METADEQRYQAFLLRLWRNRSDTPWRVSLQGAADQRPFHFQSIAQFIDFLEELAETAVTQPSDSPSHTEETT